MGIKNGKPVLRESDCQELASSSGLSIDQVTENFNSFVRDNPKGVVTRPKFKNMLCNSLGKSKKDCKQIAEQLEPHVFRIYDSNKDGTIDFVEFMVVYHVLADGTPEQVLEKLFRLFDVNEDGTISRPEMLRLVKDLQGLLILSSKEDELMTANQAFTEMDYNNDGAVSMEEFVKAVMEEQKVSKMLTLNILELFDF